MNEKPTIDELIQELARECAQCRNTFSGSPMLSFRGKEAQCKLRTCNRKKHKAKMKQLKELEKNARN